MAAVGSRSLRRLRWADSAELGRRLAPGLAGDAEGPAGTAGGGGLDSTR